MPVINRKRRAQTQPEDSQPPRRRRSSPQQPSRSPSAAASHSTSDEDDNEDDDAAATSHSSSIKKLIRLALSSEYSRTPLRRADISAKCMPPNSGRQFKALLDGANEQLRVVFGMELTRLPSREKATVAAKRAAARNNTNTHTNTQTQQNATQGAGGAAAAAAYILTSTMAPRYRQPSIVPPAQIPSASAEGGYMGFVGFVLALIYLSPMRSLSETRLEKHLKRVNADEYVLGGGERRDNVVKRMIREGYVVKVRERENGGEETVDYVPGPRGKVEVGEVGVAGMVRRVYGKKDQEREELERRVVRSLGEGVRAKKVVVREDEDQGEEEGRGEDGEDDTQGNANGEAEEGPVRRGTRGRPPANGRQSSTRQSRRRGREEEEEDDEAGEQEGDEDGE